MNNQAIITYKPCTPLCLPLKILKSDICISSCIIYVQIKYVYPNCSMYIQLPKYMNVQNIKMHIHILFFKIFFKIN